MKHAQIFALSLAVVLYSVPALPQHGHPGGMGGMGGSTAGSMGHGNAAGHDVNDMSSKGNPNPGSAHGMTMDQILTKNTALADKIHGLTGMSAQQACGGFRNLGQCVAAAHVSKNLGISFDCMKADMTGTAPAQATSCAAGTGTKSLSLGKSIQALKPAANSRTEEKKAMRQADEDLKDSSKS
jgi:hypothetical protein